MSEAASVTVRDVDYEHDDTVLRGVLCAPLRATNRPGVVLLHDAFGLSAEMLGIARRIAGLGFPVFAADLWGERATPESEQEIGPLIGAMVSDRDTWIARVALAHEIAAEQPEIDGEQMVSLGYCFGGSSAIEYVRTGGKSRGFIAIHPGLDLVEYDWSTARAEEARVGLVCLGADDPMATPTQWQQTKSGMQSAGVDWQLNLYSGTVHAFTSPKAADSPNPSVIAYHPRNAHRAWQATVQFLREQLDSGRPAAH